ncbi:MAG: LysM peptidoglycan-binding domain-containing protein [Kangiellaceae bacterium]|nr:LysM peptidoglycan-binding domain-containing protein [Kangiellaceae bacterium]
MLRFTLFICVVLSITSCKSLNSNQLSQNLVTPKLEQSTPLAAASDAKNTFNNTSAEKAPLKTCESVEGLIDPESYLTGWERIANQFSLDIPNDRRIKAQQAWYVDHPKYLYRVSKRAAPYLYFIIEEIEKRGLPLELALLPIVESAYDPFAYSHGRASGMWQFIPGTARGYGLSQNWWYDGRRDVFLSTHAALDYLSYLNKHFDGDWLLALAAYNSGQGNVRKAIRKNKRKGKPTDFCSLKLPKETKAYVPKLLALADILRGHVAQLNPFETAYGTAFDDAFDDALSNASEETDIWYSVANKPYFTRLPTDVQIDLSLAADLSGQSMEEFYRLNPAYNRWATAPKGPHYLLFPIDKAEQFHRNLITIPKNERIAFKRYKIRSGDTIGHIAQRFSTSVSLLKRTNRMRNNNIRVGKTLLIPVASKKRTQYSKSNQQRLASKQSRNRSGNKHWLKVKSGDSFWSLSREHKVGIRQLAAWNNMAPTDTLKIGQKLVLWNKLPSYKTAGAMNYSQKTKKIHYKVRSGDSFARIADKFKVSLNKIKKWNRVLSKKKYLQPGQSLTLFVDITKQF